MGSPKNGVWTLAAIGVVRKNKLTNSNILIPTHQVCILYAKIQTVTFFRHSFVIRMCHFLTIYLNFCENTNSFLALLKVLLIHPKILRNLFYSINQIEQDQIGQGWVDLLVKWGCFFQTLNYNWVNLKKFPNKWTFWRNFA